LKKKNNSSLPVYTIETSRNAKSKSAYFDIKRLEQHDREREETHHPHRHDCYLILFVTEGSGKHFIDFATYDIKPFTAFILMPGQVHSWNLSADAKGFVIFFTPAFYLVNKREKHLSDFPFFSSYYDGGIQAEKEKEKLLPYLLDELFVENSENTSGRDEILRNGLEILLLKLARYYNVKSTVISQNSALLIRQLQLLVEKHFHELKLPGEYADRLNVSSQHLNEVCKKMLNKTVSDLIHERQLLEAKRLLVYTHETMKSIADRLGFYDKSYFMRFFKKYTSLTPDQFRENHQTVHL